MHSLAPVVLVLLAAVLAVFVCRHINAPPLLGYLVVGFLSGPSMSSWIPDSEQTQFLGEIGITLMMFTIGLEFSLSKLKAMRQLVFGVGSLQVILTMLAVFIISLYFTQNALMSLALGGALAMSSTAIVSRLLTERRELSMPHGQLAIGVLLFQDLAVVPLLILLPALANDSGHLWSDLATAGVKVLLVLTLLLVLGQRLMRPWFHMVARVRSNELFMINVLLITLGIAYLTELSGLSLPLGAFVAGMLISETEYRYQVEEDIRPFRDILLGFFFITVGMRVSLPVLFDHFGLVLFLVLILLAVKFLIVFGIARAFKHKANEAMRGALVLAQGGEFSFVLLALASKEGLINSTLEQSAIAAVLTSMLCAPFLIQHAERLTRRLIKQDWMFQAANLHHLLIEGMSKSDHVLICGYGRSGQSLARLFEAEHIPFFALDMDPARVKEAADAGNPVGFGDACKKEVLMAAGIMRAKVMVIAFSDTEMVCRILWLVQTLRDDLPVLVRTIDDSDIGTLRDAGASEVIPEVLEGSLMLASHALLELGLPLTRISRRIRSVREERYGLLRGFFRGMNDNETLDEACIPRLLTLSLCEGAHAIGALLSELKLEELGIEIKTIRREHRRMAIKANTRLQKNDVLVLLGTPEQLAQTEIRLLNGK